MTASLNNKAKDKSMQAVKRLLTKYKLTPGFQVQICEIK